MMNSITSRFREDAVPFSLSLAALVLHLVVNWIGLYGYFRDEFYYIACSHHLAWGYVDQPPFSIVLLWVNRNLLGDSLPALRFLPAISSAALVYLAGLLARDLGGKKVAQGLACLSVILAPVYLSIHDFYSMNAFEPLFWTGLALILVRIINTGDQKLWLVFGLVAGLGLENKHSVAFFGVAIVLGLLAGPHRSEFKSRWLWLGGALALLLALPNVVWEQANGWPTLEFTRNAQQFKNLPMSPVQFFSAQVLYQHPFVLPIWGIGLAAFLVHPRLKQFRVFAIAYSVLFVLFILQRGKPYYLSPFYPVLLAAGAIVIEEYVTRNSRAWIARSYAVVLVIGGTLTTPLFLPMLPIDTYARLSTLLGLNEIKSERHGETRLPQVFADRFGWRELTAQVADVYHSLTPEEQAKTSIYAQNYGEAGAIDFFGKQYGLPPAISGHNNYWLWGTQGWTGDMLIIVGGNKEDHEKVFESVTLAAVHSNPYAMPYETNLPIYVCRGLKVPIETLWPKTKHFG